MKKTKAKALDTSLRLDHNKILKEIGRLGPCGTSPNCHYCRDWTMLVYKKQFVGKQQPLTVDTNQLIVKAGDFNLGIKHRDFPKERQRPSIESLFLGFEHCNIPSTASAKNNTMGNLKDILSACKEWLKMTADSQSLPQYFYPLQFDTAAAPSIGSTGYESDKGDDEENHAILPHKLTCDRQGLLLTAEHIGLLANAGTIPDTTHIGDCLSPSDLEVERAIVNESMAKCVKDESAVLDRTLKNCWGVLLEWIAKAEVLDTEFDGIIGTGLDRKMDAFVDQYGIVFPFQDYWAPLVPGFKKKPTKKAGGAADMLSTVDKTFIDYMDQLLKVSEDFYTTFVRSTMVSSLQHFENHFTADLKDMLQILKDREELMEQVCEEMVGQIGDMLKKTKTKKERLMKMRDRITNLGDPLQHELLCHIQSEFIKLDGSIGSMRDEIQLVHKRLPDIYNHPALLEVAERHSNLVTNAIKNIQQYADDKRNEQRTEIEQLKHTYLNESLPNVASRVEKVAHKDFRKKLKKIEHRYSTMRQGFAYQLKNALPLSMIEEVDGKSVCGFYLGVVKMLMALMGEGVTMEMLLVNSCVKKFYKRHENLINKRSELANAFKCGIITGQEECAVVIKTMVLAEGKRLESENEAIHREMSLAKSLGGKVSSNNKTDGATTTSLYAAIAMLPTTGPSSGDRSTSWMRKLTKERKSKLSTKNETVPDESSASSTENDHSKDQAEQNSPPKSNPPATAIPTSTSKPTAAISTSTSKPTAAIPTSTGEPTAAISTSTSKPTTATPMATTKSGITAIPSSSPSVIKQQSESKIKKGQSPAICRTDLSPVITKGTKGQCNPKAEKITVPTIAGSTSVNAGQGANKAEKVHSFSRKRHQPPNSTTHRKDTSQQSPHDEMSAHTSNIEPDDQQTDTWTSPAPSATSSTNMTWSQTVALKPLNQTGSWTSSTTTTTSSPSQLPSPSSNSGSNQPTELKADLEGSWNTLPSSLPWNQTADASAVPPSMPVDMTPGEPGHTVANSPPEEASWATPSLQQPSNTGWGNPGSSHFRQHEANLPPTKTTTKSSTMTAPSSGKKERWSSDWLAKAKATALNDTTHSVETSSGSVIEVNDQAGKQDQQGPQLVNVSLKDILANSQEIHTTNGLHSNNNDFMQPMNTSISHNSAFNNNRQDLATITPPPALGGMPPIGATTLQPGATAEISQLSQLNQDSLINVIHSLRIENQQLQQSMVSMQQALTMTMTLAKEREEQTFQLFNTRKQSEMEEARVYILALEEQINDLRSQVRIQNAASPTTNAFVNQDLFASYRQEIHTDDPTQQQQFRNNPGHYPRRQGKKPYWQNRTVVKCSNCGQSDHTSGECKDTCRYCGSLNHLSENCDKV